MLWIKTYALRLLSLSIFEFYIKNTLSSAYGYVFFIKGWEIINANKKAEVLKLTLVEPHTCLPPPCDQSDLLFTIN